MREVDDPDQSLTYNETSCFQIGLAAERPSAASPLCVAAAAAAVDELPRGGTMNDDGGVLLADDEVDDCRLRDEAAASSYGLLFVIAPRAPRAVDDVLRESTTGTPLTSFSASLVGSRLTNSLCSNWTTT